MNDLLHLSEYQLALMREALDKAAALLVAVSAFPGMNPIVDQLLALRDVVQNHIDDRAADSLRSLWAKERS